MEKKIAITGSLRRLDDTRMVFLGTHPEHPDTWFLGFRSSEGHDTKLKLSNEAMAALSEIIQSPDKPPTVYPPKGEGQFHWQWREVETDEQITCT